jgi:UDP-2-acetamido-2,6-beta-L-arabino-hexul-4-ose reductase
MTRAIRRVLVTGANGFIGKNLQLHLAARKDVQVVCFTRDHAVDQLSQLLLGVDFVFHLAGINRPQDPEEFVTGNANLTHALCEAVAQVAVATGQIVPVIFASSTQAVRDNPYGQSKRAAENALFSLQRRHGVPVHVFRLPNVFGKLCKPNYNSAVATFCHNIARGLPIQINDPSSPVTLVYVDDVISRFSQLLDGADAAIDDDGFSTVVPLYASTVGELAQLIQGFKDSHGALMTERVDAGFLRALCATYVSYLPAESFASAEGKQDVR